MIEGDSASLLKKLPSSSIDLIVTSPPYTQQRQASYGGVRAKDYVDWFLGISAELKRVLKPTGSFIINIKEGANNGQRETYVLELILALKEQGWLWTEEYIWHKKNCFPGKWPNRFRDAWERCLHFTLSKKFAMYQEAVMVEMGDWKEERMRFLNEKDLKRTNKVGNGFTRNVGNWLNRSMAYPSNVLTMPTSCKNVGHSAAFPVELPSWFIKLFTRPGDMVLDPFLGSGSTGIASIELDRNFVGIELLPEYAQLACDRIADKSKSELARRAQEGKPAVAKSRSQAKRLSTEKGTVKKRA